MAVLDVVKEHYGNARNFVDGEWVESSSGRSIDVLNPATDEAIGAVPVASSADVDAAVKAASEAYPEWRETAPVVRARYMFRLKGMLEDALEDVARIITQEQGKTIDEARGSARRLIENVEVAAGIPSMMMGYSLEDGAASGIDEEAVRQPLGVFAAVCPYNFPAMVPFWFWPYAVACGNTYIVKPSEQVPFSQQRLFQAIEEAEFPEGVINMVNGDKNTVQAMLDHPGIKGISFVGSTPVARHIYESGAKSGKRVQAQGGAKNCIVVMPDADLAAGIPNMVSSFYGCAGQRCLAGSLLVAVGDVYDELRDRFLAAAKTIKVGYGLDETSQMGPVVSLAHRDKVLSYIDKGVAEGGELLLDGRSCKVEGYEKGAFVGPTVFDKVTPEMTIAREEIFGPVASIVRVKDFDEAVDLVNASPFGNAGSIFTSSGRAAREFKYRVNSGNIGINLGIAAPMAYFPFGGYKDSFFGDLHGQGMDAINFFTERKIVISRWL